MAPDLAFQQFTVDHNVNTLFEDESNGNHLNYKSGQNNIYLRKVMTNERVDDPKGVEVDVMELSRRREVKLEAKEDPDATEYSSSFADTDSGNEFGLSEAEAESQFFGENDIAPSFDDFGSVFPMRKKKVTTHWRKYIHPLMWRCKWTELKIKELESQASRYSRYIAFYERNKHTASDQVTVEQSGSRSIPFTFKGHRKRPMKRLRRKKVEHTTDIALYMSNHNLFCERDNKRPEFDAVSTGDDLGNIDQLTNGHDEFGTHENTLFFEENDSFLETLLRKIELVHTRVHKLKTQLNSVTINNTFCSSENLSQNGGAGDDVPTSFVHSPTFSACHLSDYDLGDFMMPESSFGEAITIPDIIESTVGLLSSIDVTEYQAHMGDSTERILDNIVINNETGEVEVSTFKNSVYHNQSGENSEGEEEEEEELESGNVGIAVVSEEQNSTLRSSLAPDINFPKNKRKRGERKPGSSNWSKQK